MIASCTTLFTQPPLIGWLLWSHGWVNAPITACLRLPLLWEILPVIGWDCVTLPSLGQTQLAICSIEYFFNPVRLHFFWSDPAGLQYFFFSIQWGCSIFFLNLVRVHYFEIHFFLQSFFLDNSVIYPFVQEFVWPIWVAFFSRISFPAAHPLFQTTHNCPLLANIYGLHTCWATLMFILSHNFVYIQCISSHDGSNFHFHNIRKLHDTVKCNKQLERQKL